MFEVVIVSVFEIYDNKYEGFIMVGNLSNFLIVIIERNKIYYNGGYGFCVFFFKDGCFLVIF